MDRDQWTQIIAPVSTTQNPNPLRAFSKQSLTPVLGLCPLPSGDEPFPKPHLIFYWHSFMLLPRFLLLVTTVPAPLLWHASQSETTWHWDQSLCFIVCFCNHCCTLRPDTYSWRWHVNKEGSETDRGKDGLCEKQVGRLSLRFLQGWCTMVLMGEVERSECEFAACKG